MNSPLLPSEADVRAVADGLLTQHCGGGAYPSVSALARHFGINRTTFYRHYSAITEAMLDSAADQRAEGAQRRRRAVREADVRDNTIRRLRSENSDLRCHIEIYEEHIRMLTLENQGLKNQLDQAAGVTKLNSRQLRR